MLEMLTALFAVFIAATLVGNEFAVGFFIHPALWKLPDAVHAATAKSLAKVFGTRMPFWYVLTLITTSLFAYSLHQRLATDEKLAWISSGLWLFAIIFTLIFPVPINNKVANFDLERLPADWKALRRQWDFYHLIRNCVISAAIVCLILASINKKC